MKSSYHEIKNDRKVSFNEKEFSKYKNCKKILLVDDSIDSGNSIILTSNEIKNYFKNAEVKIAVFNYMSKSSITPDYTLYKDTMVCGPWSNDSKDHNDYMNMYKEWTFNVHYDDEKIDFVIIWVDGNDEQWQIEKNKYNEDVNSDNRIIRYRDWGLLKYWFRGVEKYAPWVNKIHFVTWGHIPKWLDVNNPKINIVNHKDFIPDEYLPTFSSHTIELNLHRIKGLSEHFVYFNDDFFLTDYVKKEDFFKNGIPLDCSSLNVHCVKKSMIIQNICNNNVSIINEHFDFKKSINENRKKWFSLKNGKEVLRTFLLYKCPRFPGFYQTHLAHSYLKSTFNKVWNEEYDILNQTCLHKFRNANDVNQWLFREWQIASGNYNVRSHKFGQTYYIDREGLLIVKDIVDVIKKQKYKMIAINDGDMTDEEFDAITANINNAFKKILPDKSSFEL